MKELEIINELKTLNEIDLLQIGEVTRIISTFQYTPIQHLINSLFKGSKPETAAADLLKSIVNDVMQIESFSEVPVKDGFIDLAIQENIVNPILIELKPNLFFTKKKDAIQAKRLNYKDHQKQIQKYLRSNDYVILTNLNDTFLFNREAIVKFSPFSEVSFTELLEGYIEYDSLWEKIRRIEDNIIKVEIEKEFFQDLKKWYNELNQLKYSESDKYSKEELIVLFLNKIIFIKTLEDHGLIPYKYLQDIYYDKIDRWSTKGFEKVFSTFFNDIEEWFWEFYDTELFKTKIWDYIDKNEKNIIEFRNRFERIVGLDSWSETFGKGMTHYNYRQIDEDVFGKAYETFLAETRKDSGIFYTHKSLTSYMAKKLVNSLFEPLINKIIEAIDKNDYEAALNYYVDIQQIAIIDPCSGSGSFLIKVLREIYSYYQIIISKTDWIKQHKSEDLFNVPKVIKDAIEFREKTLIDNPRELISRIILRHIFSIDIDERAIETAKTNLWKEAIKLTPRIFNYRKLPEKENHILPNLEANFINADALYDIELAQQLDILSKNYKNEIVELKRLRNSYIEQPFHPELIDEINRIKIRIRKDLEKRIDQLKKPTLICLEFFYLYFDYDGNPLPKEDRGFAGVISNPPWEEIYPVRKEFANVGKYSIDLAEFEKEFNQKIENDEEFAKSWSEYLEFYNKYTEYVNTNYEFHKMKPPISSAMRTHLNYFKVFFERNLQMLRKDGLMNILIPSSFQTDEGSYGLRTLAFIKYRLIELFSFENRGFEIKPIGTNESIKVKIFPDVHPQFKFSVVLIQKSDPIPDSFFNSLFYEINPETLINKDPLKYSFKMVKEFSPDNLSIMEFRSMEDYIVCSKILEDSHSLRNTGIKLRREFNLSDDKNILVTKNVGNKLVQVFEGKNIHQFNSNFSQPTLFVKEEVARKELIRKEAKRIKKELKIDWKIKRIEELFDNQTLKLDYETFRLSYRVIGRSTDERTFIASIIPQNTFSVYSVYNSRNFSYYINDQNEIVQEQVNYQRLLYYLAVFNSLTINYYLRNKISANLTTNFLYELPIPKPEETTLSRIVEIALQLLVHKSNDQRFTNLGSDLGFKVRGIDYIDERSKLEVMIARDLYKLSSENWTHIISTFIYGEESDTKMELDKIIKKTTELF